MTNISSQITHYTTHLNYISLYTHTYKSADCWTQRVTRGLERLPDSESLEGPYCLQTAPECRYKCRVLKLYTSNPAWEAAGGRQSCCRVAESSQTSRSKLWSHRTWGMRCRAVGVQCWTEGCRIIDMRHRKGTEWGNDRTNEQQFEWVTLSNGEAQETVGSFLPASLSMCTLRTGW